MATCRKLTLITQQCCRVVLRRGFLAGRGGLCVCRGEVSILSSLPGRKIAELSCRPLGDYSHFPVPGCFLMHLTSEGTRKVKAAKVEPSYPELPTSSVSWSLEMKFAVVQWHSGALYQGSCSRSCFPCPPLIFLIPNLELGMSVDGGALSE